MHTFCSLDQCRSMKPNIYHIYYRHCANTSSQPARNACSVFYQICHWQCLPSILCLKYRCVSFRSELVTRGLYTQASKPLIDKMGVSLLLFDFYNILHNFLQTKFVIKLLTSSLQLKRSAQPLSRVGIPVHARNEPTSDNYAKLNRFKWNQPGNYPLITQTTPTQSLSHTWRECD